MSTRQKEPIEQQKSARSRRAELVELIARGEDSLFACDDDRTRRALDQKITAMRNELQQLDALAARCVHETFHAFKARMNCACIQLSQSSRFQDHRLPGYDTIVNAGHYLFSNGALSDGDVSHQEPPTERLRCLLAQRRYFEVAIEYETKVFKRHAVEFDEMDSNHLRWPMSCPASPVWANDELRRRQAKIAELQEQLEAIDEQISAHPEAQAQAHAMAQGEQARREQAQAVQQRQRERADITR